MYRLSLSNIPEHMRKTSFEIDGSTYAWMSVAKLEMDSNTMKNNDDVIAFVKTKCH